MSLLEIKNLSIEFRTTDGIVKAVNHVDLSLNAGETLGLVGETGAGKTTTALGIMRLVPDPPGVIDEKSSIMFDGQEIMAMKKKELQDLRGAKISMIFQDPMTALNPVIKVEDQIAEIFRLHRDCSKAESLDLAHEMLEMVGIEPERGSEYPHQFSGGMKQRVVIAIALACRPELLIADEPTTALDVTIQAQVLDMIRELKEKLNTSMLLITHDLGVVAETCDKVAIMYAGEIIEYGTLRDIFKNTAHPYTRGLFNSLPSLDKHVKRLSPISGLMPDPTDLPKGCKFNPRCPYAIDACKEEDPQLNEVAPGHVCRCIRCHESNWLKTEDTPSIEEARR